MKKNVSKNKKVEKKETKTDNKKLIETKSKIIETKTDAFLGGMIVATILSIAIVSGLLLSLY